MRPFLTCVVLVVFWLRPAVSGDNPQAQAEALLERARQLSDLRRPGAGPFQLKADFSFTDKSMNTVDGTYTETWLSESQWRRETELKDFKRIEVGTANRLWLLDSREDLPEPITRLPAALEIFPISTKYEFDSVVDQGPQNADVKCALTHPVGTRKAQHAFCFDTKHGVLLENVAPEAIGVGRLRRTTDYSCRYDNFKKFGENWFPYDVKCLVDGHPLLSVHVVELGTTATHDQAFFAPPAGALELGWCPNGAEPPKPMVVEYPRSPMGERDRLSTVVVRFIVDIKGNTKDVHIVQSGGRSFDEAAIFAVVRWKFFPGKCNGQVVAQQMRMEIPFGH
jgi:TonB family protein